MKICFNQSLMPVLTNTCTKMDNKKEALMKKCLHCFSCNREDLGSIRDKSRYLVARITT